MSGAVFGRPGANLEKMGTARAAAGARAERATAARLRALAADGYAVIHSLKVPGVDADVDHVVVGSRGAVLVDSKLWRAGWYVGRTNHWRWCTGDALPQRFPHASSPSLALSVAELGAVTRVAGAVVAVWSSHEGACHTALMRYAGGFRVLPGTEAIRLVRRMAGRGGADPAVVNAVLAWGEVA